MKYLRKFNTQEEYDNYLLSPEFVVPNVSLVGDKVYYHTANMKLLPLFVEAIEPLTVSFSVNPIEYSLDNYTWQTLPVGASTPTIEAGRKVYFRASGLTATSADGIGTFSTTGMFNVGGNIMSMAYGADFKSNSEITQAYQFKRLFRAAEGLVDASKLTLPSMTMTKDCYHTLLARSTSLIAAPALPAIVMAENCYLNLCYGCSSLEVAPDLPATDLTGANSCYNSMFAYCSKLRYLKAMILTPPPNNSGYGYQTGNWLKDVASSGVFVKNSEATWSNTRGDHYIPEGWTIELADE